jgi:chloramphenicol 3-O-phosphotransferase
MQDAVVPLLLLCGAPGTGKSSVAWEVYWLLMREGVSVAHVDLDAIGYGPPGHSGSFDLKFANVGALWGNYSDAGASALVVSGLRRLQSDVFACAAAVPGSAVTAVVLTTTVEEQRERILTRANTRYGLKRGGGSSAQTPEALERVVTSAAQQLEAEADEIPNALVLDTVGVPVVEIARQLLQATGWPDARKPPRAC